MSKHVLRAYALAKLGPHRALRLARRNLCAINHYYIVERPLASLPNPRTLRNGYRLDPVTEDDITAITHFADSLPRDDHRELLARALFYKAGFQRCFFLRSPAGGPVFLQWLVTPPENAVIREHFPRRFAPLRDGEVMVENAFCFPRHRGFGWLPAVTLRLMMLARDEGFSQCIGYIRSDNIPSLNSFSALGFRIRTRILETKIFGVVHRHF